MNVMVAGSFYVEVDLKNERDIQVQVREQLYLPDSRILIGMPGHFMEVNGQRHQVAVQVEEEYRRMKTEVEHAKRMVASMRKAIGCDCDDD